MSSQSLTTTNSLVVASTLPYGVFDGNDNESPVSTIIIGLDVTNLTTVEGWDLQDADASISFGGLTITGVAPVMVQVKMNIPLAAGVTRVQMQ